ncbi:MAG: molybdenum cofactor guanylyltransferase [Ferrimicrobium sp.]|jgi:molybdopterin-guanine dinucleotide biosynthesis protein A|uniref:NTP transferase domain-containing protein n=1 Tax=Ferrimicrobium acidiphilum TaxID=121039 RepID=A0ABV3Y2G3_9ACTN|nr:NTP transferase domain-containing protein [Ferrimicrobium sp.]
MTPLVCLLTGGRSLRMGRNKAELYRDSTSQVEWLVGLAQSVVGQRVIEVGSQAGGCEYFIDSGAGPAQALHEAASAGALGTSGTVVVVPIDLFRLEASGLSWLLREALRIPCVVVVDGSPSWTTFGIPVSMLLEPPVGGSLRSFASSLRRVEVPQPLAPQFRDSDYPSELPANIWLG